MMLLHLIHDCLKAKGLHASDIAPGLVVRALIEEPSVGPVVRK